MAAYRLQFNGAWSLFSSGVCAAAALLVAPGAAPAQAWKPQQPVEVIIGSAAGSSPDSMARYIQKIWHVDGNQLERQLMSGREARKYMDDLAGPLKTVLGDLGLLR